MEIKNKFKVFNVIVINLIVNLGDMLTQWLKVIVLVLPLLCASCNADDWEPYRPTKVIIYGTLPPGGIPGSVVTAFGENFSSTLQENVATIGGLPTEVLAATENELTIRIPEQAVFAESSLIISSAGLSPDTTGVIISELPLARITNISPDQGPSGTVVTVRGSDFNPDEGVYTVIYQDTENGFFIPRNEDTSIRNTLISAHADSLTIEIPNGFREGGIVIFTETVGRPLNASYQLVSPSFTVL